jgi:2-oxo-4-hydroxy-4-carboxy-5-ureidoimidazoline decarboxylase
MDTFEALKQLNALEAAAAVTEFLKCCGSTAWAQAMAASRPFTDVEELLMVAGEIWFSLGTHDWHEAFSSHPKIGERKLAPVQSAQSHAWSDEEQAGARAADAETLTALAEANRVYEEKFGHIFIVCATGKTAAQMLTLLRARLPNDPGIELHNAAHEQLQITRLRLEKLLQGT